MATKAYRALEARNAELTIKNWNLKHPAGTSVRYWPGAREGEGIVSKTRSEAWLASGQAIVLVEDKAGGIALSHVEVIVYGCEHSTDGVEDCDQPADFLIEIIDDGPDGGVGSYFLCERHCQPDPETWGRSIAEIGQTVRVQAAGGHANG